MNLNESIQKHIEVVGSVTATIIEDFAKLNADTPAFNVLVYSKSVAKLHNVDDLFVANLVRSIVNASAEFESRKGRNGGVIRKGTRPDTKKQKAVAQASQTVSTETEMLAVEVVEPELTDESNVSVIDDAVETSNDNDVFNTLMSEAV
jgi:hypothetical protein